MVNGKGVQCITAYHELGELGGAATKAARIEPRRKGYVTNQQGKR